MAKIVVGNWNCTYEEIMSLLQNTSILNERGALSKYLGTSEEFMEGLEGDLDLKKMNSLDAMIEILVEWRSRNSKASTLGTLLEIFGRQPHWLPIKDSIRNMIMLKAKNWLDLDEVSRDQILKYEVEFQGNMFALENLKFLMKEKFETFLSNKINQNVIHQVLNLQVVRMQPTLHEGFITSQVLTAETNEIKFKSSEEFVLGVGSGSTVVYKGTFGNNNVAVKKISSFRRHKEAENEIQLLVGCNGHQHVVHYFAFERYDDVYLLALELCHKNTLKDWIANHRCLPVEIDDLSILKQATDGLDFLHEENIIHRDLKPSNISFKIIGKTVLVRIADFGISRLLPEGETSKTVTSYGGSCGWTAAEMLEARQIYNKTGSWATPGIPKLTKKIDVFSLGCIFYVVLENGSHPFGTDHTLYDHNIKSGKIQAMTKDTCLSLKCNVSLVYKMIAHKPDKRPDTEYIRAHPIFWSHQKMISFICKVSNFSFDVEDSKIKRCAQSFEEIYFPKILNDKRPYSGWLGRLNHNARKVFRKAHYDKHQNSAIMLIRLIRNLDNHYKQRTVPLAVKQVIGEGPQEFMTFWLRNFPTLINELRDAFTEFASSKDLKDFYILKPDIVEEKTESVPGTTASVAFDYRHKNYQDNSFYRGHYN